MAESAPGNPFYNSPLPLHLTGEMHVPSLERALSEIMSRHEVLRTRLFSREGHPEQVVSDCQKVEIAIRDLSEWGTVDQGQQVQEQLIEESAASFRPVA